MTRPGQKRRLAEELAFNEKVGGRLRDARLAKSPPPSLDLVGAILGVDGSTVQRHEGGKLPLTCVRAWRWCQYLGLDLGELFQ